jgi:hypothetical protein
MNCRFEEDVALLSGLDDFRDTLEFLLKCDYNFALMESFNPIQRHRHFGARFYKLLCVADPAWILSRHYDPVDVIRVVAKSKLSTFPEFSDAVWIIDCYEEFNEITFPAQLSALFVVMTLWEETASTLWNVCLHQPTQEYIDSKMSVIQSLYHWLRDLLFRVLGKDRDSLPLSPRISDDAHVQEMIGVFKGRFLNSVSKAILASVERMQINSVPFAEVFERFCARKEDDPEYEKLGTILAANPACLTDTFA